MGGNQLIVIDAGNSRVKTVRFDGDGRIVAEMSCPSSDLAQVGKDLDKMAKLGDALVALCSVVPSVTQEVLTCCEFEKRRCIDLSGKHMALLGKSRADLGADLAANAVAGWKLYGVGKSVCVFGFGTASTAVLVSACGEDCGYLFHLGLSAQVEALGNRCALLKPVSIEGATTQFASDTEPCMRNGGLAGHLGLIEFWKMKARKTLGRRVVFVATGGWGEFLSKALKTEGLPAFSVIDPMLTLQGARLIALDAIAAEGEQAA